MITTNDYDLWNRMWSYKDHGKSWDAVYNRDHPPGFRWVHESFGTNWRMLEMQAAIGRIQLTRMEDWTALRTRNACALQGVLKAFPDIVRTPSLGSGFTHAYYRQYSYIKPEGLRSGWTRDRIIGDILHFKVVAVRYILKRHLMGLDGDRNRVYRSRKSLVKPASCFWHTLL